MILYGIENNREEMSFSFYLYHVMKHQRGEAYERGAPKTDRADVQPRGRTEQAQSSSPQASGATKATPTQRGGADHSPRARPTQNLLDLAQDLRGPVPCRIERGNHRATADPHATHPGPPERRRSGIDHHVDLLTDRLVR